MPNLKLGVTATELFTYNPYRILGTAVDTPAEKITELYNKLLEMAESGTISQYTTKYDFPVSLPPFQRDSSALKTAYAKVASNGYRCFAYSSDQFATPLNIDDIMLNLRDITCYDCFLRCYMWLITNDRDFEEKELWVLLCKYIDSMIMSTPDQWTKFFDHRFPENMMGDRVSTFRTLYATFCDIILLPIKEMVRGSMKCSTATEILEVAGIDVNEEFEYVDIPQANVPKPGQPAPLLKIAVKDGEEYFDVTQGHMVSFKSETEAVVESNQFDTSTRTISAAAIIGDKAPVDKTDFIPPEPTFTKEAPPEADKLEKIKPLPVKPKATGPIKPAAGVAPAANVAAAPAAPAAPASTAAPAPVVHKTAQQINEETVANTDEDGDVIIPTRKQRFKIPPKNAQSSASLTAVDDTPNLSFTTPNPSSKPLPVSDGEKRTVFKKNQKSLADFVDEVEETPVSDAGDEEEDEENIYTNVLIKMLRSNRAETMKGVDTKHVFDNGDSLGIAAEPGLEMDAINEKRKDNSLLTNSLEPDLDTDDPKKLMAEKYKGINIDDMLNPISPNKFAQGFKQNAIHEYQSNKARTKKTNMAIIKFILLLFMVIMILVLLYLFGVL